MNARTWKKLGACLCAGTLAAVLCAGCASKASDDAAQPLVNGVTDRQEVVYCLYFGSSAARYAAASYRASRKRRIERCERRLLLRAAFAQKPSFVRCLKTALSDECC